MKILFYGLNFAPELVGCAKYNSELVEWLIDQGHEVRVICAPPYYPQWQVQKPFSAWRYHRCDFSHKQRGWVVRCPIYVPQQPTGLKRLLHLGSFALSSLPVLAAQIRFKPDLVFTVAPTLFCAPAAAMLAAWCGAASWLHIQDFEVDAAFELGMLRQPYQAAMARFLEQKILQAFSLVSTISQNMLHRLHSKGLYDTRIFLLANWIDVDQIRPLDSPGELRQSLNISADKLVCLFSGNLGVKQGLDMIIDAARELSGHRQLHFVICGNGPQRRNLEERASGLPNLSFIDLQPAEKLNELLNLADIHLLPQLATAADLVMPSKLTGMLASGRPVVASATPGTEIARALQNCGLISPPGDHHAFSANILQLVHDHERRLNLGGQARLTALQNFDKRRILAGFQQKILELTNNPRLSE